MAGDWRVWRSLMKDHWERGDGSPANRTKLFQSLYPVERGSEMSDTRKAVVTTAQVQDALNSYTQTLATISGQEVKPMEFDKGARGKGFATYDSAGNVVGTFDTKEDAYVKFSTWVSVANEVLSIQQNRSKEETPKTTRKPAEKVAA